MIVIGLTGGIATGKSTVASMFAELGADVISADQIAREIVEPGQPALAEIVEAFGESILNPDGSLNRAALAEIVFSDPQKRKLLESITHPRILEKQALLISQIRSQQSHNKCRIVIVEAPLLFEAKAQHQMDCILVVTSEQKTQIARLMERSHLTREQAEARIAAQMPLSEKSEQADWVISTDGTLEDTRRQVKKLWDQLQSLPCGILPDSQESQKGEDC